MAFPNTVDIRERRLHTILTYNGTAESLNRETENDELKIGKFKFMQCGNCQQGCASMLVYQVRDTAVVSHTPVGCYAGISMSWLGGRMVAKVRNRGEFEHEALCTNIQEKDTIYGGAEKLREAVVEANRRYNPKIIYITTACASGIVGDDVQSVADEMTEELGKKVIAVECEGFKSRIWSTGFDAGLNGIIRSTVQPPKKKQEDLVNIFNFSGVDTFSKLLGTIGLRPNFLVEQSTVEQLNEISEAACSATICETLATFAAHKLEEEYGVPEVKAPAPYGIQWTDIWLREVAKLTNRTDIVEEAIRKEHERIEPELSRLREYFKGKKVYIFSGCSYAHNMASVCKDLGLEIIGITTYHHDQTYDTPEINTIKYVVDTFDDIPNYTICNKQPYQVIKFLKNLSPDFLIVRHPALTVLGYKLGIPSIMEGDSNKCVGYDGIIELGNRIQKILKTRKLSQNIAEHVKFPYSEWWMKDDTDPFYFVGA